MQNYVQNASVNIFNRCYWNFSWWQTYLDVLVNLYFEIYFVKNLICLIFLVSSFYFSWYFQCESPLFAIDVISNFNFFFWICSFHAHYHVYRKRTFLQNYINFIQMCNAKNVNTSFVNNTFYCLFFFRRGPIRLVKK